MPDRLRVVIAEDTYLVREGTRRVLEDTGEVEVIAAVGNAAELMDSKNRLSADLFAQSGRRYMKVLREMIGEAIRAGELEPSRMQSCTRM